MSKDSESNKISRRNFLGKAGTGIVGSTILISSIGAADKTGPDLAEAPPIDPKETDILQFWVNGKKQKLKINPSSTLAEVLRNKLNLTGTKIVCNQGACGGCTVVMDNKAVYACHMLALDAAGKIVVTIEGLLEGEELNHLQEAFIEKDGLQCGFCTPGQIMSAYALLLSKPKPNRDDVIEAMSGNICRCGAYPNILDSVLLAAQNKN
jgi:aerobic-type carbon monoxide dehydrogenase small subunit (CoxS/CutS family)